MTSTWLCVVFLRVLRLVSESLCRPESKESVVMALWFTRGREEETGGT